MAVKKPTQKPTKTPAKPAAKPKGGKKGPPKPTSVRKLAFGIPTELSVTVTAVQSLDGFGNPVALPIGIDFLRANILKISGSCSPNDRTTITVTIPGAVPNPATVLASGGLWSVQFTNVTGVTDQPVTMRVGAKHPLHGANEAVIFRKLTWQ